MRWLIILLIMLLLGLQYNLWIGEDSLAQRAALQKSIQQMQEQNKALQLRNQQLAEEVVALKKGPTGIEGKARSDLGMVKEGETFFMVIQPESDELKDVD